MKVLYKYGDIGDSYFFILEGEIEISDALNPKNVKILYSGEIFPIEGC